MERLRNKEGNAVLMACVIVLVMMLIFTVIAEYLRLKIIAKGVRDGVQSSVISVVTNNWDNNFNGLRQGYAGGYTLSGSNWNSDIDNGAIYAELSNLLGLQRNGAEYVKYASSQEEYAIYDLSVNVRNTPFRGNENDEFSADAYIVLRVPLEFGWGHLPDMVMRQKVKAKFTPKF
ncbi:hypothetical protein F8154_01960 [Alkaliphilus pronyensis]|uniref:Uncharacterized protein n=1 Tax=Alkaliphilus pronyensis TaxID=1482732 RepID=A0A6I0FHK1_9FIRM|nr:hypothetical protein [Alkaliphilus pronyensis]KAB3537888.1 hypothetical protein F8154_01960 [Alkaliphilus pronyensis]